jgi:hypothetical protein
VDALSRLAACRAPHQVVWLCRLEAAKLRKVAEQLRRAEKAAALRKTRESLADVRKGLGYAFKKLRAVFLLSEFEWCRKMVDFLNVR